MFACLRTVSLHESAYVRSHAVLSYLKGKPAKFTITGKPTSELCLLNFSLYNKNIKVFFSFST